MPPAAYAFRHVAFIDVLGWRGIVSSIAADPQRFESILAAYSSLNEQAAEDEWVRSRSPEIPVTAPKHLVASDSIVLSADDDAAGLAFLLVRSGKISSDLLRRGFLTRGAVVKGRLYHEGNVIFGEALTTAYELEQHHARFPRIVITDEVHRAVEASSIASGPWSRIAKRELLRRDSDMAWRLNPFARLTAPRDTPFTSFLRMAGSTIAAAAAAAKGESEPYEKIRWLARTYNLELSALLCSGYLQDSTVPQIELPASSLCPTSA